MVGLNFVYGSVLHFLPPSEKISERIKIFVSLLTEQVNNKNAGHTNDWQKGGTLMKQVCC